MFLQKLAQNYQSRRLKRRLEERATIKQEKEEMAKTRIKNTPTRLQKDALIASASASAAVAVTTATATVDVKKRLVRAPANTLASTTAKEQLQATSTIIIPAPKRTNSISSATSMISHLSDTHSAYSDTDSPPLPPAATTSIATISTATATAASNASKTLNNVLCAPQSNMLKNRKVFMITEKCEEPRNGESSCTASAPKRKMYLIMEENATAAPPQIAGGGIEASHKYLKMENGGAAVATATKKLTLYADKCDGELTQKFEKILPEILHRIQGVKGVVAARPPNGASTNIEANDPHQEEEEALKSNNNNHNNNKRLQITLPPKKNRTKIITMTQNTANMSVNQNNNNDNINNNNNKNNSSDNGGASHVKQTSAATTVIVSAASLNYHHHHPPLQPPIKRTNGQLAATPLAAAAATTPQKNINLSTDFLFLMKMLPKLESIPESHKNHVRSCIEKIVTQNASPFEK